MLSILSERKQAVTKAWLALTLAAYPGQSRQFLLHETDYFRNPVGQTLKEGIPLLVDEVFGDMNYGKVKQALEGIVRIRAVQNFSAKEAVGFVFLLKRILREQLPADGETYLELDNRVDEMILVAFDLYVQCRQQIYDIQVHEARRRVAILERVYSDAGER